MSASPLTRHASGPRLAVSVQPQARRTGADGLHDGALRVRLAAPPVDGKANQCLIDWLAGELGCPKRAIRVLHGASARRKVLGLELPFDRVEAWLKAATSPTPSPPAR